MVLRVPTFVVVSTTLGVVAHCLADPRAPAWRLLVVAALGVLACALPASRREVSLGGLVGLLALSQAVVHGVLCLCHCAATSAVGVVVHRVLCPETLTAEQVRWAADPLLISPPAQPDGVGYVDHLFPGGWMLAGHVAAAVVTSWWLRRGEAAVWRAALTVWPRLVMVVLVPDAVPAFVRPRTAAAPLRSLVELVAAHRHRGPPVLV